MKDVQAALTERRLEALRLWVPMPKQEQFHSCIASERLVIGGNRCLSGDQVVWDPVRRVERKVSEIDGPFWVDSLWGGERVKARAGKPFVKARETLYAFALSNGGELRCTLNHLVLSGDGQWTAVRDVLTPECAADLQAST
jgi:hypothetical protein